MNPALKIELTKPALDIVQNLQTLPVRIVNYIAAAMNKENQLTVAHIQQEHLTGTGPFPVEEHRLGVRTSRLRGSVRANDATVAAGVIDTTIGSNVKYAAIHEFGGRITIPAREQKIRLRTDRHGNLLRQVANSNLAVFAGAKHKRARESTVHIDTHEIEMLERAPFRTGIAECAPNYKTSISAAIVAAWNSKK